MKKLILLLFVFASLASYSQQTIQFGNGIITTSGTITTQNLVPAGTATAGSSVTIVLQNHGTMAISISGTWTGALSMQSSIDASGAAWQTYTNASTLSKDIDGTSAATVVSGVTGVYVMDVTGLTYVRITALAAVTGTATIYLKAVTSTQQIGTDENVNVVQGTAASLQMTATQGTAGANAWPVVEKPGTSGGFTMGKFIAAASTNATSLKASVGQVYAYTFWNKSATNYFIHLYNKASAPTVGTDVPVATIMVPASSVISLSLPDGAAFATGIAYAATASFDYTQTTAITAIGDMGGVIYYF